MNRVREVKDRIRQQVREALSAAAAKGLIPDTPLPDFSVDAPREKNHGDFAVNAAMVMRKQLGKAPREIAQIIVDHLDADPGWLSRLEIAGPGFLNFHLAAGYFQPVLEDVLREGRSYGSSDFGGGRKVQIEFVSANPTGLLHMGNARGAALGDSLASVMQAAGYAVSREYYINDAGNQIENFGKSLEARYLELLGEKVDFPEDGYQGEDIIDTAREILNREGERYRHMDSLQRREQMVIAGLQEKLDNIRQSLESFGVQYDVWFSEQSLHEGGKIEETIRLMKEQGLIYEKDGAVWLKATAFGDEKDEVMLKATGAPTYFAGDIAYHRDKFERGYETVINIWGADHHGHVARMKAAMGSLGYDPADLEVILMQLVRLIRDKEIVRMSKRSGQYVTLDELVEEVGKDAARFFFILRSADSQMDFDLDLAKSQSSENPVYYVQYAHARIHSLLKMAKAADGQAASTAPAASAAPAAEREEASAELHWPGADLRLLTHPAERELIRKLADLPEEIMQAALDREPHRLPRYTMDLAVLFHSFYTECRCLVDEWPLRQARLQLCDATRIVLRNTLELIGVNAPERM
ncbi:MAG: arginine--tRNA ligase [Clostridiales bacterium]|nr:arginine--tRNA ligase [Clostridiales bacterium]